MRPLRRVSGETKLLVPLHEPPQLTPQGMLLGMRQLGADEKSQAIRADGALI